MFLFFVVAAIVFGALLGYQFTQRHYFVGVEDGRVAIFQGIQQDIGPISLSHVFEETTIEVEDLPVYRQTVVEATINATDLADARRIVEQLSNDRLP